MGANTDTYGYLGTTETAYEVGNASTDAIYDASGARLAIKTGSTLSYVIFDLHGSVVALCPSTSTNLSDAYRYDPWGQLTSSGTAANPWRYRGLLDVSPQNSPNGGSQVYDMGARFYSPQLGTFTAEDSTQGKAADPLSMNRFVYAEADPATLIDPDGHMVLNCGDQDFCAVTGTMSRQTINTYSTSDKIAYSRRHHKLEDQAEMNYMNRSRHGVVHTNWNGGPQYMTHRNYTTWNHGDRWTDDIANGKWAEADKMVQDELHQAAVQRAIADAAKPDLGRTLMFGAGIVLATTVAVVGCATVVLCPEALIGGTSIAAADVAVTLAPSALRFSQSSVNDVADMADRMSADGWVVDPADAVVMPDGALTTIDNSRVLAANQAGIDVQALIHKFDDVIESQDTIDRLTTARGGAPSTWGDAVLNRIGNQSAGYRSAWPFGSPYTSWDGN